MMMRTSRLRWFDVLFLFILKEEDIEPDILRPFTRKLEVSVFWQFN